MKKRQLARHHNGLTAWCVVAFTYEQTRDSGKLEFDLLHHFHRCHADGLHSESSEPVRKHRADEEHGEDDGLQHVKTNLSSERRALSIRAVTHESATYIFHAGTGDEASEEGKRHKRRTTDGEALTNSGRGVTSGVEGISLVANGRGQFSHLGDATGVVADGAIHLRRNIVVTAPGLYILGKY